jgi:hypothetical protein
MVLYLRKIEYLLEYIYATVLRNDIYGHIPNTFGDLKFNTDKCMSELSHKSFHYVSADTMRSGILSCSNGVAMLIAFVGIQPQTKS